MLWGGVRNVLTGNNQQAAEPTISTRPTAEGRTPSDALANLIERMPRIEWLGQTAASLCWIASVLAYGISSTGDWLQLLAASSWLVANLAARRH